MNEHLEQQTPTGIDSLRQGRIELASLKSANQFRAVFATNKIDNPDVNITRVNVSTFGFDCNLLGPNDFVALDGLGVDTGDLSAKLSSPENYDDKIADIDVDDEHIKIDQRGSGLVLYFQKDGYEDALGSNVHPKLIRDLVSRRFANSPGHAELHKIHSLLADTVDVPQEVSTSPFDPDQDPMASLAFLVDVGLLNSPYSLTKDLASGKTPSEIRDGLLATVPEHRAVITETEDKRIYTWGIGVVKQLTIDNKTGTYSFSVKQDPAANYPEQANQSSHTEIPFIDTECASELCGLLDASGLMFHPSFQAKMMDLKQADRYGSIYTEISRKIAKWINRPEGLTLSSLFVPANPEYTGIKLAEKMKFDTEMAVYQYQDSIGDVNNEEDVRKLWQAANRSVKGEAANVLVDMINGSLDRGDNPDSDLEVTGHDVKIRDGACFDVIAYYLGAATHPFGKAGLVKTTVNEVDLLEKTYGSPTFLSTVPIVFNGVKLPKGSLFTKNEDGWAFLRTTVFAFDEPADQIAVAGSEMAKALANQADAAREIGGTSLANLVEASR